MSTPTLSHEGAARSPLRDAIDPEAVEGFEFFPINLDFPAELDGLYVESGGFSRDASGALRLEAGGALAFDGYFSALYERDLAEALGDRPLELRLELQGAGRVELWRRPSDGPARLAASEEVDAKNAFAVTRLPFALEPDDSARGRWWFALKADGDGLTLRAAAWTVRTRVLRAVRPEIVICTFRRETQVARNVSQLQAFLDAKAVDWGVTVVDNAGTLIRAPHWSQRVTLIAQRNVGGAGGFARGILEAMRAGRASHVLLMDDDAEIDCVSVLRMINLFRLDPRIDVFYGGAQLDVFEPQTLADAGAYWRPSDFEKVDPRLPPCDLASDAAKQALAAPSAINFNGWWFFGGAIDSFRRFGMPLPCFVHLDDVEYGVRVAQMGGKIVAPPGVAIWHEPYYAKLEGWFAYYNIRNELIRYCLQTETGVNPRRVLRRLRRRHRGFVLTQQYGAAALLTLAMQHFLRGPAVLLDDDPERLHREVMEVYKRHNGNASAVPLAECGPWRPARRLRGLGRLIGRLTFNGHLLPRGLLLSDIALFENRSAVHRNALHRFARWGHREAGSDRVLLFALDRGLFRACMGAMLRAEWGFAKKFRDVAGQWRASAPALRALETWEKFRF
ncbi:hypothetical protein SAMN06265338_102524 [Rhodoblastus acidophilus]|uniref:Glycosyltransferase n=1 Tax=Rhodoblastus acidophilus TaxID=1074 RepID=A0A212R4G9_RHOAC|nr:glycosyltransferase [Rhodoblastus acidophilus]PPQ40213.1 hypothetical protein CKO16_00110 [Rhodoblastus acidophilus]RAI17163.1 hypothetical protein CH337_17630 [Rhodoblastus acidophilus]SNB66725.1 hypothetical protein SAMN06265338_102524 [Rhodoblastus acidophilus]